ncbi:MAG: hypothetical protein QOF48_1332 [Verrucomicrobiota bacterium]|jgi:hypothetical protein
MNVSFRKKIYLTLLVFTACSGSNPTPARADFYFGPPVSAGILDGNSSLPAPFFTSESARFQQVYSAEGFSDLNFFGGGFIHSVIFRVDATLGSSFQTVITSMQLTLSTTARTPDNLSPTFADNIGSDATVVLGPSAWSIGGAGGGGFTGFNVAFSFPDHGFFYSPVSGSLLVDLQIFTGAGGSAGFGPRLDAFTLTGDEVSSVLAYGSTLPTTGQGSTLGLATAFSILPVPEPSTWALLMLGLPCIAVWESRRRTKYRSLKCGQVSFQGSICKGGPNAAR